MLRKKPVCSPALVLGGTLEFRNHGRSVWLPRKQFLNLNGENNILFTCYLNEVMKLTCMMWNIDSHRWSCMWLSIAGSNCKGNMKYGDH